MWLLNEDDDSLNNILVYVNNLFFPFPSNNQFIEGDVKDTALCRWSGRSEHIALSLNFFRSTITSNVIADATLTSINSPQKVRRRKRKRDTDDVSDNDIWICKNVKIKPIFKGAHVTHKRNMKQLWRNLASHSILLQIKFEKAISNL